MPRRLLWTVLAVCLLAGASRAEGDLQAALAGLEERLRGPAREWSRDEIQAFRRDWKAAGKSLGPEHHLRFARLTIEAWHTRSSAEKSDTVLDAALVRGQGLDPSPELRLTDLERRLDELRGGWTPSQQVVFEGAWAEAARRLQALGEASDPAGLLPRFLRLTVEAQLLGRPDAPLVETLLTRPSRPVEAAPGGSAALQDAVKKIVGVNLRDAAQWSRRVRAALERLAGDPALHAFLGTLVGAHDARAGQLAAAGHGQPPLLGHEWLQRHPRPERASSVAAGAKRDPRNDVGTVR